QHERGSHCHGLVVRKLSAQRQCCSQSVCAPVRSDHSHR
ncbi:hypothetical protein scyTo_0019685, partial [Scyliorhinus torazame]|nr:hypothetical protein [Scyliorhinus torazame]